MSHLGGTQAERDLELPPAQVAFDDLISSQRGTLKVRAPGKHSQRAASMKDTGASSYGWGRNKQLLRGLPGCRVPAP